MAAGDVKADIQSIAAGVRLDIQPALGEEWVIHNIYHEDAVDIEAYDGTNTVLLKTLAAGDPALTNVFFRLTNTDRIRVKNNHASVAKLIGYSGVQTK